MEAKQYQQKQKVKTARTLVILYAKELVKDWEGMSNDLVLKNLKESIEIYDMEVDKCLYIP